MLGAIGMFGTVADGGPVDLATDTTGLLPDASLSTNVPLKDAANVFTGTQTSSSAEPRILFNETDQAADEKLWDFDLSAKTFKLRSRTDADGAGVDILTVTRGTGTAISAIALGVLGITGGTVSGITTLSVNGQANVGRINLSSTTVPAVGAYVPGTNRLGFSTNTTYRGEFDANGQLVIGTAGRGLSVPEGSNAKMGVATLVGGTVTVSTTAVTANSRVLLTSQVDGGTPGFLRVTAKTGGTSFVITSSSGSDTSTVAWFIVEPSP